MYNPMKKYIGQFALVVAYLVMIGRCIWLFATCTDTDILSMQQLILMLAVAIPLLQYWLRNSKLKDRWANWHFRCFCIGPKHPWLIYGAAVGLCAALVGGCLLLSLEIAALLAVLTGLLLFAVPYIFGRNRYAAYVATVLTALLGFVSFVLLPTFYTVAGCVFIVAAAVIALLTLDEWPLRNQQHRRVCVGLSLLVLAASTMGATCFYLWLNRDSLIYFHHLLSSVTLDGFAFQSPWQWAWMTVLAVSLILAARHRQSLTGGPVGYAAVAFIVIPMLIYVISDGLDLSLLSLPGFGLLMSCHPLVTAVQVALLVGMYPDYWYDWRSFLDDASICLFHWACEMDDEEE